MTNNTDVEKLDNPETPEQFLAAAWDLYQDTKRVWQPIHDNYKSDCLFASGEQWDAKVKAARKIANLSSLVYNKIPAMIKYIVNNARSATPAIKCYPVSGGASQQTAKIFDGLIKSIETQSNANTVYSTALTGACTGGLGCWYIEVTADETKDIDQDGEADICLEINRVLDPTTVMYDPSSIKMDRSDASYWFHEKQITAAELKRRWPDAKTSDTKHGKTASSKDKVTIVEYWCRRDIEGNPNQICKYTITASDILEADENYLGVMFPYVYMSGQEIVTDDGVDYRGIVRDVRDMQMFLNLAESKTADDLGRQSDALYFVKYDQVQAFIDLYLKANQNGLPIMPYAGDVPPTPIPPSNRSNPYQEVSAKVSADIRDSVGVRDPLRDIPASQSGKAISLQISQGNIGTYEYVDHLNTAIKRTGQILIDLIPRYYNYEHIRQIQSLDGTMQAVPLNQPYQDDNGNEIMHDLALGRYTVAVTTGPSYESQRTEASDKLMDLAKQYPQFLQLAGDIIFRNFDFAGASEIADRLRSQIPPEVLASSDVSGQDPAMQKQMLLQQLQMLQANMQQLQQQAQQQIQQLQQQNTQLNQQLQSQILVTREKNQNQVQLKQMDNENKIQLKQMDNQNKVDAINEQGLVDARTLDMEYDLKQDLKLDLPTQYDQRTFDPTV